MKTWAYAFELNHPGAGVGVLYYAERYFDRTGIVNPASGEAYIDSEIEDIRNNASEMDVPEGALFGMSTIDGRTVYWYDEENAGRILASAAPLVLNKDTGSVLDGEGNTVAVYMIKVVTPSLKVEDLVPRYVDAKNVLLDGEEVLRLVKNERLESPDIGSFAKVDGLDFHNGTIEVKVRSRVLPEYDGPDRGAYVGVDFRILPNESKFESFYLRPSCGLSMTDDPKRQSYATQYFSFPGYTFFYFREFGITQYDCPADIRPDEWIQVKYVIKDGHGMFYVNGELIQDVDPMIHGADLRGTVGLYTDTGTEAFFKDLKITFED